jgi:heat shock protein HslJ
LLVAVVPVIALVAGCGEGVPSSAGAQLDGHDFFSVSVSENGRPRPLVAGTRINLRIEDGHISANAGCNMIGTAVAITSGTIASNGEMASTAMGCDDARHAQDEWLAELLREPLNWRLDGDRLELWNSETNVVLREG